MSAEYSAVNQIIQPNQPVIYLDAPCPCSEGLVFKKSGGVFLLANNAPTQNNCSCGCGCRRIYETNYEVEVNANIQIPEGGTVEEIQLAIAVDGVIDPASVMRYTPSAVEVAGNVGTSIIVSVQSICGCESIAIVNASTQPIQLLNSPLVFDYAGVRRIF
jgi:hypothetical protein